MVSPFLVSSSCEHGAPGHPLAVRVTATECVATSFVSVLIQQPLPVTVLSRNPSTHRETTNRLRFLRRHRDRHRVRSLFTVVIVIAAFLSPINEPSSFFSWFLRSFLFSSSTHFCFVTDLPFFLEYLFFILFFTIHVGITLTSLFFF